MVHISVETELVCVRERVYNEDGLQYDKSIKDAFDLPSQIDDDLRPIKPQLDEHMFMPSQIEDDLMVCLKSAYYLDKDSPLPLQKLSCTSKYCTQQYVDILLDSCAHYDGMSDEEYAEFPRS